MMKKSNISLRAAIVLLLVMLLPLWAAMGQLRADEVTAEQARHLALTFLNSRTATAGGPRRAPVAPHQLSQEQQVSGLYVFNVAGNGGFVIVSNDDRTNPVLGYADSGTFDSDNIPSNMRAWLQGYADEIAWVKEHSAATPLVAKVPRREPAATKAAIEPLLTTKWNQDSPYNEKTPYYGVGSNGYYVYSTTGTENNADSWRHCATGCVATAMAQVMNYHKWPKEKLPAIPGYKWANYNNFISDANHTIGGLSEIEFTWNELKDSYDGVSTTSNSAKYVATLMQYCGWSVAMNYGPESGSNTDKAAEALKNYFDYKETTQVALRKLYTATKWTDLIYYELSQERPVIYGGQSTGGGHEFVCDGYKYENETDLFHINWGWGGLSDGYFVLSALDPDAQGIGGSTSNDGYRYYQDAVIGIQKSTDNGTMSGISANEIHLTLNSMTLSCDYIANNSEVSVTLNITNNSPDDFEGDVYIGRKTDSSYSILEGNELAIPAGQTADCVIPFTPTETGTYSLVFWWPNATGGYTTDGIVRATLTVVNEKIPTRLAADNITPSSAIVSWAGNSNAISYNIQYRTVGRESVVFSDGFENGLGKWTIYTVGEYGNGSGWFITSANNIGGPHGGSYLASAWSWNGAAYNADNWLITPQMSIGSSMTFWVRTNSGRPDSYEVLLSNTGNAIADFTVTLQEMAEAPSNGEWNEVTIDLSAYEGQQGYIAIHHVSNNCNYLFIDDFSVNVEAIPDGEWVSKTTNDTNIKLTGLAPETSYEYQVQAIYENESSDWSRTYTLTTPPYPLVVLTDDATDNSSTIGTYDGKEAIVTLSGRTLYKDGAWNTLCLPFDVTLADSPLAGATAKTLTDATMTGTTVSLTFGSNVDVLEAGKPYIIKWEKDSGADLTETDLVFPCVTIKAIDKEGRTISKADGHVKFIGYYDSFIINTPDNDDIYYMTADNTLKHTGKERTLKAFRAYFQFSENIVSNARKFVIDYGEGKTTTIESSQLSTLDAQRSEWYTLDGRHLMSTPTKKGIYINGNKKRIVR